MRACESSVGIVAAAAAAAVAVCEKVCVAHANENAHVPFKDLRSYPYHRRQ